EQFAAAITQFAAGDLIDLPLGTASFQQYAGGVLSLNYGGQAVALQLATTAVTPQFQFTPDGHGGTDITVSDTTPCFCRGTRVMPAQGGGAVVYVGAGGRGGGGGGGRGGVDGVRRGKADPLDRDGARSGDPRQQTGAADHRVPRRL